MTAFSIATLVAFVVTMAYLLVRVSQFYKLTRQTPLPRPRFRARARQMYVALGLWQISVALVLIAGPTSSPALVISLFGVGLLFLFGSWFSGKLERALP